MIIETTSTKNTQVVVFNLCGVIHAGAGETLCDAAADLAEILVDKEVEHLTSRFEQAGGLTGSDSDRIGFFSYAKNLGYKIRISCGCPYTGQTSYLDYKDEEDIEELNRLIYEGYDFRCVDFSYTGLDEYVTIRYRVDVGAVEFIAEGGFRNHVSASSCTLDRLKEQLTTAIKDFLLNHR